MTEERNGFIDLLKGLAILLVVIGHCIEFGSGNSFLESNMNWNNALYSFIYSFHMPLFACISGYLFYFSICKHTTKNVVISKMKSCLMPVLTVGTLLLIISVVNGNMPGFLEIISNYLSVYWFLCGIFFCSIIVLIINRFLKDSIIVYIFGCILSMFVPDVFCIYLYKFILPFFILGYLYNKHKNKLPKVSKHKLWVVFFISLIIYIGLMLLWNKDAYIYTTKHCILNGKLIYQTYLDFYRTVVGLIGTIMVISAMHLLCDYVHLQTVLNGLINIGKNSIGIYVFSLYLNQWVLRKVTFNLPGLNIWILMSETALMVGICYLLTYVCKKNKVTNLLLLGGR